MRAGGGVRIYRIWDKVACAGYDHDDRTGSERWSEDETDTETCEEHING